MPKVTRVSLHQSLKNQKVSQSAKINVQHVHVTRKARSASNSIRDSVQKPVEDNSNLRPASTIFSHASEENPMKQESTLTTPFTTVTTVQEGKPRPLSLSELLRLPLQAQRQQQRQQRQQRQQQQQQLPLQQRLQQPLQQRLRQPLQQPLQPPLQQRLQQPLQQPLQQQRRQQRLQQQLQQRLPPSLQQPLQQRLQQPLQQRLQQPLQQRL
ncbi:unnamed protein product [Rotaria sp. Silwood1]|nr:unnamed protein product [Rotaria sp. Silwood1]